MAKTMSEMVDAGLRQGKRIAQLEDDCAKKQALLDACYQARTDAAHTFEKLSAQQEARIEKLTSQRNYWKYMAERAAELLREHATPLSTEDDIVGKLEDFARRRDQWLGDWPSPMGVKLEAKQ
jgi:hypothetical protein